MEKQLNNTRNPIELRWTYEGAVKDRKITDTEILKAVCLVIKRYEELGIKGDIVTGIWNPLMDHEKKAVEQMDKGEKPKVVLNANDRKYYSDFVIRFTRRCNGHETCGN